jgi:hypothetical protein
MNPQHAQKPDVLASCQQVESRLQQLQQSLRDPAMEIDHCHAELGDVIAILNTLAAEGVPAAHPDIRSSFRKIKRLTETLHRQFEHAANLCLGWNQLRLGTGYTEMGTPVLLAGGSTRSFEG